MADSLEVEVMARRFTSVVERIIEREHLPLNRAAKHKATRHGVVLSGAARASEIMSVWASSRTSSRSCPAKYTRMQHKKNPSP
jgi:hypothetical protein